MPVEPRADEDDPESTMLDPEGDTVMGPSTSRRGAGAAETTLIARGESGAAPAPPAAELLRATTSLKQRMKTAGIKVDLDIGLWRDAGEETGDSAKLDETVVERGATAEEGPAGEMLDRYRIVDLLGSGGMGVVHLVEDGDLGRLVAAKVLPEGGELSEERMRRFLLEARVSGQLQHPGIVPVYELGLTDEGRIFFTMKRVQGVDLGARLEVVREKMAASSALASDYRASLRRSLEVLLKVCDALSYAHSQGVIHRDLKPSNIMVGRYGEALVMDWGLAKILGDVDVAAPSLTLVREEESSEAGLVTLDGSIVGTPAYMPPEQARGDVHLLDQRSDVYALGAILHEILCFEPPYDGGSAMEVLQHVLAGDRRSPIDRRPDLPIPWELVAVVDRAMSREPDRRYRSVDSMREDLDRYLVGGELAAVRYTWAQRAKKWVARNALLVGSASAALVAIGIASAIAIVTTLSSLEQVRHESAARKLALTQANSARTAADHSAAQATAARSRTQRQLERAMIDRAIAASVAGRRLDATVFLGALTGAPPSLRHEAARMLARPPALRFLRAYQIGANPITAIALSADGRWLATGDERGELQVRDRRTMALRWAVGGHSLLVTELAFGGADGRWLVSSSLDRSVRSWSWREGGGRVLAQSPTAADAPLGPIAIAPGGKTLALSLGNEVDLIALDRPANRHRLGMHKGRVRALAFSGDGTRLLSGGADGTARLWDTKDRRELTTFELAEPDAVGAEVHGVGFAGDGRAVLRMPGNLLVSDLRHEQIVGEVNDPQAVATGLHLRALKGRQLAVLETPEGLRVYDVDRRVSLGRYYSRGWRARSLCLGREGLWIGTWEGGIAELDFADLASPRRLVEPAASAELSIVTLSPEGDRVAYRLPGGFYLQLPQQASIRLSTGARVVSAAFDRGATRLAALTEEGELVLWDASDGKRLAAGPATDVGAMKDVLVMLDPETVLVLDSKGFRLWRAKGKATRLDVPRPAEIYAVRAVDSKRVLFARKDGESLDLWDVVRRERVASWPLPSGAAALRPSPDGRRVAIGRADGKVVIRSLADPLAPVLSLNAHAAPVRFVAWSPDGRIVASVADDERLMLWDSARGRSIHPPHELACKALAIGRRGLVHVAVEGLIERRGLPRHGRWPSGLRVDGTELVPIKARPLK